MGPRFRQDGSQPVRLTPFSGICRRILSDVRDAVFAPSCPSCGLMVSPGRLFDLCDACSVSVLPCSTDGCAICGAPDGGACVCRQGGEESFDSARSAFVWAGPVREIVLALKYSRRWDLARPMGMAMAAAWRSSGLPAADIVTSVPLSWRRYMSRGYNQAGLLAAEFCAATGMSDGIGLLGRAGGSGSTRGASREARLARAAGTVHLQTGADLDGAGIILVDDVLTTGATAAECARALKIAGAARVDVVTFARAAGGA